MTLAGSLRCIVAATVMLPSLMVGACGAPDDRLERRYQVGTLAFVSVHDVGPPLSAEEDALFLVQGTARELVFRGYGGRLKSVSQLNSKAIIIEYCGGKVSETASFRHPQDGTILAVQPVVSSGISAQSKEYCIGQA